MFEVENRLRKATASSPTTLSVDEFPLPADDGNVGDAVQAWSHMQATSAAILDDRVKRGKMTRSGFKGSTWSLALQTLLRATC